MIEHFLSVAVAHTRLAVEAALVLALLGLFTRWERRGRELDVLLTLLGVVLLDAVLFPSTQSQAAPSVFHVFLAGYSFRLTQLLIAIALCARVLSRGWPSRVDATMTLWVLFFFWYLTAGVAGVLQGHSASLVISRSMLVLEAGGMMALASGISLESYLDSGRVPRFLRAAGLLAGINFVLATTGTTFNASLPELPLVGVGEMGSDAATLFPALGFIGLAVELGRRRRSPMTLVACGVLVASHLASIQRAARLGIGVTLLVFLVLVLWPRSRRFAARGGDWAVAALIAAAIVVTPVFVASAAGGKTPSFDSAVPFSQLTVQAISPDYRQGSVQARYTQWSEARRLIKDRPIVGYGLGEHFVRFDQGARNYADSDLAHDIVLDLLLRTGIVGLGLFVIAVGRTVFIGWIAWRRSVRDEAALMAAMTLAVLCGYLAKGAVESVLNEYRLTPLLGLTVGLLMMIWRTTERGNDSPGFAGNTELSADHLAQRS